MSGQRLFRACKSTKKDIQQQKTPDYQAAFANFEEYVFFKGQNVLKIITKEIRASGTA